MDGSSIGRAIGGAIVTAIILAFFAGVVVVVGCSLLFHWLADHLVMRWIP